MLKNALEYIVSLGEAARRPNVIEINGHQFCDKRLDRYDSPAYPDELKVSSLSALIKYIKSKTDCAVGSNLILHIQSPRKVSLFTWLDYEQKRIHYLTAVANTNEFNFEHYYDQETFLVALQSNFVPTEDLQKLKQVAGNIQSGTTADYSDDGVSQQTTIRTGIANHTAVIVPNPVFLRPYRTFAEIEQPESGYVFRIHDSKQEGRAPTFMLAEADAGVWKTETIKKIEEFLSEALAEELQENTITILA